MAYKIKEVATATNSLSGRKLETSEDLTWYLGACISVALQNTISIAQAELREIINKKVYSSYSPIFYDRTYQLLNAWKKEVINNVTSGVVLSEGILEFDSSQILFQGIPFFEHGSYISAEDWCGNEEAIPDRINSGNIGDAFNFPLIGSRPFWDDFMNWFRDNYEKRFKTELSKQGIKLYD